MAWLLIDNSNTRTKFRLGDSDGLLDWNAIVPTRDLEITRIRSLVAEIDFSAVVVASVVSEKENILKQALADRWEYHRLTCESPLGYGFELEAAEQIGHDRLSNVVALKANYGASAIAIDFGTAVTFSVLSEKGNFVGGVIAPGMDCMTDYLSSRTAQLPVIRPEEFSSAIGKTTVEAMQIGAVAGHRGMVREILREIISEMHAPIKVVATGGGAEFSARGLPGITNIDLDLTLEGLRIVAGNVFL